MITLGQFTLIMTMIYGGGDDYGDTMTASKNYWTFQWKSLGRDNSNHLSSLILKGPVGVCGLQMILARWCRWRCWWRASAFLPDVDGFCKKSST